MSGPMNTYCLARTMFYCAGVSLLLCTAVHAQTLAMSSPSAAAGAAVAADIVLTTPAGSPQASSLEWTVIFPSRDLTLIGSGPMIDPSREAAGKSLVCRGTWKKPNAAYSFHCLLVGGNAPLTDGPLVTLRFQVRRKARPGTHALELENLKGVTAAAKTVRVNGSNGSLTVVISPI